METIVNIIVVILAILAVIILLPFAWHAILWILANLFWIAVICIVSLILIILFQIG